MRLSIVDHWSNKSETLEGSSQDIENQLAHRYPEQSLDVPPEEGLDALVEYLNQSIAGTEFTIEPLDELSKAQTPPKAFPKLGVHSPGDSIMPVDDKQRQLRVGLGHAEATKDWPEMARQSEGYKDQRTKKITDSGATRGQQFGSADSNRGWARATHPFEDTFHGTLNHETFHSLMTAAGQKYGMDAQQNLARNLFNAIPKQYHGFLKDQQHFYNSQYAGTPHEHEELLARVYNYLNSDADRQSFHRSLGHTHNEERRHNIAIKRAAQALQAIAPTVGKSWLNRMAPWRKSEEELDLNKSDADGESSPHLPEPAPKPKKPRKPKSATPPEEPTLVVHHNLTAANLIHAHGLGGLIAPSLAISHKDHPLTGFGEITLIGDDKLADPAHTPVFDADVYSPRHPKPKYRLNEGHLRALQTQLDPHIKALRSHKDFRGDLERGNVDDCIDNRDTREPLAAQFFAERGHAVELPMKPVHLVADWVAMPAMQKWVQAHPRPEIGFGSEDHKSLSQAAKDSMTEWEAEMTAKLQKPEKDEDTGAVTTRSAADAAEFAKDIVDAGHEHHFHDGMLNFNIVDKVNDHARKVGTLEPDTRAYGDTLQNKLKSGNHEQDFRAWAKAKLQPIVGEPYIPKRSPNTGNFRKIPYTPENILREMTRKIRAGEDFHYGLGTARSMGAKKFKNLQQLKNDRAKIVSPEEMKIAKEKQEQDWNELVEDLRPSHHDPNGFHVLDGLAEAIGSSYSRGKSLRNELDLSGFKNLSDRQILACRQFADNLLKMPTEYFEAKPQRVVPLREFRGAVIPKGTEPEVRAVLRHHGIDHVEEYNQGDEEGRKNAIHRVANAKKLMLSEEYVGFEDGYLIYY